MCKTVVLTTVFDLDESIAHAYFYSLARQTYIDFDLVLVNDGFTALSKFKESFPQLNIIELPSHGTIAKNRESMIRYALCEKYKQIIFCDFDDYFSDNRVEKSLELLDQHDLVVNDLDLVINETIVSHYLSRRYKNRSLIGLTDILEKNFIGLSNTAVKTSVIPAIFFPDDLMAVDWYFFSNLLVNVRNAIFTDETVTFYRQHESNMAGMTRIDGVQLKKEIGVKKKHYSLLSKHIPLVIPLLTEILDFDARISDPSFLAYYLDKIVQFYPHPLLWWELFNTEQYKELLYAYNKDQGCL